MPYCILKTYKTISFVSKPTIEDMRYERLTKKHVNVEFAANRDSLNYEKFGNKKF